MKPTNLARRSRVAASRPVPTRMEPESQLAIPARQVIIARLACAFRAQQSGDPGPRVNDTSLAGPARRRNDGSDANGQQLSVSGKAVPDPADGSSGAHDERVLLVPRGGGTRNGSSPGTAHDWDIRYGSCVLPMPCLC